MASAGYARELWCCSQDKSELYVAETFWSRGSRGDRTDVVTIYDAKTLEPTGEVMLPAGRFLVVPKKHNPTLTTDGRYLLSFNMDPAFSLSVVDIKARKYVGEIETGGCSLAYPTGPASVRHAVRRRLVRPHHLRRDRQGHDRRTASRSSTPRTTRYSSMRRSIGAQQARRSSSPTRAGSTRRSSTASRRSASAGSSRARRRRLAARAAGSSPPIMRRPTGCSCLMHEGGIVDPQAGRRRGLGLRRRRAASGCSACRWSITRSRSASARTTSRCCSR